MGNPHHHPNCKFRKQNQTKYENFAGVLWELSIITLDAILANRIQQIWRQFLGTLGSPHHHRKPILPNKMKKRR